MNAGAAEFVPGGTDQAPPGGGSQAPQGQAPPPGSMAGGPMMMGAPAPYGPGMAPDPFMGYYGPGPAPCWGAGPGGPVPGMPPWAGPGMPGMGPDMMMPDGAFMPGMMPYGIRPGSRQLPMKRVAFAAALWDTPPEIKNEEMLKEQLKAIDFEPKSIQKFDASSERHVFLVYFTEEVTRNQFVYALDGADNVFVVDSNENPLVPMNCTSWPMIPGEAPPPAW
eukprot:CAMPEP_0178411478 /NCGR_PEP_ID=MMETSP0689_2-20121128/21514_1 /TAXON_ID=160604 /ORGANISM="Amphidinium massartii, Strain CS-259" /LENGTH=221 /DNA_ID=CAMNT_0020032683 /DNA_START=30 /DNA_END=692 /DNA_ORIENTATION=+